MKYLSILFSAFVFFSCQNNAITNTAKNNSADLNPAAKGFQEEKSDAKAIQIADEVMKAMGGRKNWDETRFIKWTFFGRRQLIWDKHKGDVRIDIPADSTTYLVNIFSNEGKVKQKGVELSNPDSINHYLKRAESIWINDSYWLVMPFKLKDSGVSLKYVGVDTTQAGKNAEVLELTFENIGDTPDNKYLVYVDQQDKLIKQWDFYTKADDKEARFSTPWVDYQSFGNILLSGNRGRGKLSDIGVYEEIPSSVFTSFNPINLTSSK